MELLPDSDDSDKEVELVPVEPLPDSEDGPLVVLVEPPGGFSVSLAGEQPIRTMAKSAGVVSVSNLKKQFMTVSNLRIVQTSMTASSSVAMTSRGSNDAGGESRVGAAEPKWVGKTAPSGRSPRGGHWHMCSPSRVLLTGASRVRLTR